MIGGASDLFLTYSILRRLTRSYDKWPAFKTGVIDKDGNILVAKEKRTDAQRDSFRNFDTVVLNMKKLLAKLPGGSSKFATYSAALFLIREPDVLKEDVLEEKFKEFLDEEAPTNAVASGHIAGAGPNDTFMGRKVFDVDAEKLWKARNGKHPKHRYKKYVGDDEIGEEIRDYGRKNPKKGILLRNSKSGEMVFLRRGK